jgi:predicted HTH transcriptional regulator
VILGIDDETRSVVGVDDPEKVLKELWDLVNDPKKVSVNLLSPKDVEKKELLGRTVIEIHIPRAEHRKRPVFINGSMDNGTYKRNGEGDYHCSVSELQQMLRDASETSPDSEVMADLSMDDLDSRTVSSFRERVSKRNPAHPWNDREDAEFLRLIGACAKGDDGRPHPTLAGLLMFGFDYSIMTALPNYHLDYLEFSDDTRNWSYRISTGTGEFTGNLYNFIVEVANRLLVVNRRRKEIENFSNREDSSLIRAQRELAINALIHADHHGTRGIRIEWRENRFSVRNPGILRIPLVEMITGGISDPRNPRLALMFGLIGMVERAGSGVSDVVAVCREMGIPDPLYIETSEPETVTVDLRIPPFDDVKGEVLTILEDDPKVSLDMLSKKLGLEKNKLVRLVNSLKNEGKVERIGGTRGYWVVDRTR